MQQLLNEIRKLVKCTRVRTCLVGMWLSLKVNSSKTVFIIKSKQKKSRKKFKRLIKIINNLNYILVAVTKIQYNLSKTFQILRKTP